MIIRERQPWRFSFTLSFPSKSLNAKQIYTNQNFHIKTKKHRVRKHDALFGALTRFELVTITHASVPLPRGPKDYNGAAPQTPAAFAANGRGHIKTKKHRVRKHDALFGAANQIRTGDLVLTKDLSGFATLKNLGLQSKTPVLSSFFRYPKR